MEINVKMIMRKNFWYIIYKSYCLYKRVTNDLWIIVDS